MLLFFYFTFEEVTIVTLKQEKIYLINAILGFHEQNTAMQSIKYMNLIDMRQTLNALRVQYNIQ